MKEKVRAVEKEEADVYYEIIGMLIIFLSFISLGGIGKAGFYIGIFFRLLFGDWYYIILIFFIYLGVVLLVKHEFINYKSLRMNGILLLYVSLSLLSHVKLHDYTYNFSSNSIIGLWKIYLLYFENFNYKYVYGSGIIIAIFYEIIYFLLGKFGIIIISMVILSIAISFLTNNTLSNVFRNIKNKIGSIDINLNHIKRYLKNIGYNEFNIESLDNINDCFSINNKGNVYENKIKINEILENKKIAYEFIDYKVSYMYTRMIYYIDSKNSLECLNKRNNIIIYDDLMYYIDVLNEDKNILPLKKLILLSKNKLILGMDINNEIIEFDYNKNENIMINGINKKEIKAFISSFIIYLYLLNIDIYIYEKHNDLMEFNKYKINNMEIILKIISERENLFTVEKINDIEESDLKRIFFIINDTLNIDRNVLLYIIKNGFRYGIHLLLINNDEKIDDGIRSNIKTKILFKSSINMSNELIENDIASNLYGSGDIIYKFDNKLIHGITPSVTNNDINSFLKVGLQQVK